MENNDLISRSALIKAFLEHRRTEFETKNKYIADEKVIALIVNAQTVEVKEV